MVRLSGMVICKDEAARISDCLEALVAFCDEVVVIDSGSTDGTIEQIRGFEEHRVKLIERAFVSYNDQKEFGRERCQGVWVLNIDADEIVTEELAAEVRAVADGESENGGYRIPFRNHFRGVWVRRCGYYPDRHIRLVRRESASWDRESVHDRVVVNGPIGQLSGHIDHYSFESVDDFIAKSNGYASLFARTAHAQGRRAGVLSIFTHTVARFTKAYFLRGGFLEGPLGLTISGLQAYEAFQKYVRLWELSRFDEESERPFEGQDG